jgi:hypothetical protein
MRTALPLQNLTGVRRGIDAVEGWPGQSYPGFRRSYGVLIAEYGALPRVFSDRRIELRLTMIDDLDCDAGLQSGYSAKLLCRMRKISGGSLSGRFFLRWACTWRSFRTACDFRVVSEINSKISFVRFAVLTGST